MVYCFEVSLIKYLDSVCEFNVAFEKYTILGIDGNDCYEFHFSS